MSYNPLANEKYATLMMAIEDAATLNKEEIKDWFKEEVMKLETIWESSENQLTSWSKWETPSPNY